MPGVIPDFDDIVVPFVPEPIVTGHGRGCCGVGRDGSHIFHFVFTRTGDGARALFVPAKHVKALVVFKPSWRPGDRLPDQEVHKEDDAEECGQGFHRAGFIQREPLPHFTGRAGVVRDAARRLAGLRPVAAQASHFPLSPLPMLHSLAFGAAFLFPIAMGEGRDLFFEVRTVFL